MKVTILLPLWAYQLEHMETWQGGIAFIWYADVDNNIHRCRQIWVQNEMSQRVVFPIGKSWDALRDCLNGCVLVVEAIQIL